MKLPSYTRAQALPEILRQRIEALGYDTGKLRMVPQSGAAKDR